MLLFFRLTVCVHILQCYHHPLDIVVTTYSASIVLELRSLRLCDSVLRIIMRYIVITDHGCSERAYAINSNGPVYLEF